MQQHNSQFRMLQMLASGEASFWKPNPAAAWKFMNLFVPDGRFCIGFTEPFDVTNNCVLSTIPEQQIDFGPDDFDRFQSFLHQVNGSNSRKNVVFDPNCSNYCTREKGTGRFHSSHIGISCFGNADEYPTKRVQSEFLSDMLVPDRRPQGLPKPSALWATGHGVSALWTLSNPVEVSGMVELEDTVACVLDNEDFEVIGGRFHQLPFTLSWSRTQTSVADPKLLEVPYPFRVSTQLAQHDSITFHSLI